MFDYHYELLCKRVMQGETLTLDLPEPLPDRIERKLDREEAQARIRKMRTELDL